MASLIVDYELKKKRLEMLQGEVDVILNEIENDENSKQEMSFLNDVREMMEIYEISEDRMYKLLFPHVEKNTADSKSSGSKRKRRKAKVFKNPYSNETIETRGGNHTQLKKWRTEYGDEVNNWVIEEKD